MIDLPAARPPSPPLREDVVNPFSAVITPEVVQQILLKQVERAQAGDSRAAALVLKIALASSGKNQAPRKNPETRRQQPPTAALVATQLRGGPVSFDDLACRLACDPDELQLLLDRTTRFAVNCRGEWSLAPGMRPDH